MGTPAYCISPTILIQAEKLYTDPRTDSVRPVFLYSGRKRSATTRSFKRRRDFDQRDREGVGILAASIQPFAALQLERRALARYDLSQERDPVALAASRIVGVRGNFASSRSSRRGPSVRPQPWSHPQKTHVHMFLLFLVRHSIASVAELNFVGHVPANKKRYRSFLASFGRACEK